MHLLNKDEDMPPLPLPDPDQNLLSDVSISAPVEGLPSPSEDA